MSTFQFPLWISALLSLFYFSTDDKQLPQPIATETAKEEVCEELQPEEKLHKSLLHKKLAPPPDTIPPQNPNNHQGDATHNPPAPSPIFAPTPTNVVVTYELAPDGKGYYIYERVGGIDIKPPSYITFDDYIKYRREKLLFDNSQQMSLQNSKEVKKGLIPTFDLGSVNDIFGGGPIEIKPTGMFSLNFAINTNRNANPALSIRQQKNSYFDFDQQIQIGVNGQIGNKMKLNLNQDTKATFDFENILKLHYTGDEDQIIQSLESGNVSMQTGNSLIQGSQNLFGIKAGLKFGPVNITGLASLQRGQKQTINVKSGAIETPFKKSAADYDANRHYFLSHYFRSKYDDALSRLPQIKSEIRINQVEVWVSNPNVNQTTGLRPAIGFIDMGENNLPINGGTPSEGKGVIFNTDAVQASPTKRYPDKQANNLYGKLIADPTIRTQGQAVPKLEAMGMVNGVDFQWVNLRKLQEGKDYTLQGQLGYISLNSPLQSDDVLFVSFSYTIDGKAYQVGEFSNDIPANATNTNPLFLKMLRPSQLRPISNGKRYPVWDLMMKNIYSIAYGLSSNNFKLQVMYESGKQGKLAFLPTSTVANRPLIQVMNLDNLTNNTAPNPDNLFDYLEGLTVLSDKGYIIFPVLEPFGSHLSKQITNPDDSARYVYQPLYDKTYQDAITLHNDLNKYTIEGTYQGANNSEIPLNTFNVSPQSVTVTANGVKLQQGTDYEVDQAAGKVIIKNPAYMAPGQDIKVDVEQQQIYQMQTRTLTGLRAEMNLTNDIKIGGSMLHLNERPTTFKVTLGDEPLNNTIWGFDVNGKKESKFLTKMIDKLPLISTKAPSNINFSGEWAQFIPGQPRQLKNNGQNGIIYLDDFEAAKQPYDLTSPVNWKLASFPRYQPAHRLYDPTQDFSDKNAKNFSRAKLTWYRIDPQIYNSDVVKIPTSDRTYSYTRPISPTEIFPTATVPVGSGYQSTLDLHYFPTERGSYNYQYDPSKVDASNKFIHPDENWAGVMADVKMNTDFEAANVEFIEFWMMDPFMDNFKNNTGGQMYFNLGNISEDVLPDNLQSFENALPLTDAPTDVTITDWARIPNTIPPSNSFSNGANDRDYQDVGLDGMRDNLERQYFQPYLDKIAQNFGTGSAIYTEMSADPSTDNYTHHLANGDQEIAILDRFKPAYGTEGNSRLGVFAANGLTLQGTPYPDMEDLNRNGTPNTWEEYFEYKIDISKNSLVPGQNYIVDNITTVIKDGRGNPVDTTTWFQVRIPIKSGKAINNIPNFKVINFMRMYMTGFEQEAILRVTDLQLVSTQWRRYVGPAFDPPFPSSQAPEPPFSTMDIGSVSVQDNSKKEPFNYMMPPGILRQGINGNTTQNILMDERSLLLKICGLKDGESQGVFKNVSQDLRNYKNLRMWVHAEAVGGSSSNFNQKGDASIFVRLGLDNDYNYYEYEMPLTPSVEGNQSQENIWANAIDFALARLTEAKQARNDANFSYGDRFTYTNGLPEGHKIYVKGTAKLSDVRSVFIGIRNPHAPTQGDVCLEVWLNELRLTDFDQESSWAANANMNITLADIGSIQASLQYRQAGFGPLEQKLSQKSREGNLRYTVAGDFSMGKFFPQKWGINLPVHVNYDEQFKRPVFDPREADVKTDDLVKNMSREEKNAALFEILDYTRNKGISLMNVKKNKDPNKKKSMPWDISNFDASFAFAEQYGHNYLTETRYNVNHKGGINYRYNIKSPNIQPFKKWKKKNPISEFNFSPFPSQVSVSLLADRTFTANQLRATTFGGESAPVYTKNFVLTRNYNLAWDLTKNLKLNFTAANQGRVDEVKGYWNDATQTQKDSVAPLVDNLFHIGKDTALNPKFDKMIYSGRTIGYNHNINLQYNLPLKNYKWTDWISGTGTYTATFNWMNPPEAYPGLGATISNTRAIQTSGNLNMMQLYTKSKFLKKMLDNPPPPPPAPAKTPSKDKKDTKQKGKGEEESDKEVDKTKGKKEEKKVTINPDWPDKYKLHPPKEYKFLKALLRTVVRLVLSVRKIDVSYNQNDGTTLPGYMPKTDNLGLDVGYLAKNALQTPFPTPSLGFVVGDQKDIRGYASNYYWISKDTTLSNYFAQTSSSQLTVRANVEPMPGFTVDLNATRNETNNFSEMFRWDNQSTSSYYRFTDQQLNGTYTCSYIFISSAFESLGTDKSKQSASFDRFSQYRQIISDRLAAANPATKSLDYQGKVGGLYANGYTGTAQDVLIPSLLAGYGVINPNKIELSPFPKIPLPNWNVTFNPMTAFPGLKNTFQSVSIKHTYRGTYTIGSFNRNLNAQDLDGDGFADNTVYLSTDANGNSIENFNSVRNIQLVQITEQLSPLVGINATTKKGLTISASYGRGRQLTFNMGNLQLTDIRNQDLSVTAGWRKDKLNMRLNLFGKEINLKNTLEAKVQLTMRDMIERNRTLDGITTQALRGQINWIINPYLDYTISSRLSVKAFWQQNINNPHTSQTFKNSFRSVGVQLRFSLN